MWPAEHFASILRWMNDLVNAKLFESVWNKTRSGSLVDLCEELKKSSRKYLKLKMLFSGKKNEEKLYELSTDGGEKIDIAIRMKHRFGSGAVGSVFEATIKYKEEEREIALKEIRYPGETVSPQNGNSLPDMAKGFANIMHEIRNRATREAVMQTYISCTCDMWMYAKVPQVYFVAVANDNGYSYIGMEHAGKSLRELIRTITLHDIKEHVFNVACTLDVLQDRLSFMHNDLYIDNVLVSEPNSTYIADLGASSLRVGGGLYTSGHPLHHQDFVVHDFNKSKDLSRLINSIALRSENDEIKRWCASIKDFTPRAMMKKLAQDLKLDKPFSKSAKRRRLTY